MGKKSGPPAPDYTGLAEKTAASNTDAMTDQTWANRANQTDPWGSVSWSSAATTDPATGKPVTQWTQNTQLDPRLQQALDSQINMQNQRSGMAEGLMDRVQNEYSTPMQWGNLPAWGTTPNAQNLGTYTDPSSGQPQQQNFDTSRSSAPQLQTGLNFGGVQSVDSAAQARSSAEDAIYKSATSRLDPQWQQRQTDLETQLANSGISRNSDAYSKAMSDFNSQRTDAYNQAQMSAVTGGGAEAQRSQSMDLGLRQQEVGEIGQQGQFANTAQGQQFTMGQQARDQQQAAQQAAWQQSLAGGQYGLSQQQQAFGQQQAANTLNFGQQAQQATMQNQQRQQQLTEAMQQRGFSLNEIQALLNGQQVSMPQFSGYSQAGNAGGVDYSGAAASQFDAAQKQQAASNASTSQMLGGAASLAMMFSDRATKVRIKRLGSDPRGFGVWLYRYIGEARPRVGVIAQEVRRVMPAAVQNVRGVLRVNYAMLKLEN